MVSDTAIKECAGFHAARTGDPCSMNGRYPSAGLTSSHSVVKVKANAAPTISAIQKLVPEKTIALNGSIAQKNNKFAASVTAR